MKTQTDGLKITSSAHERLQEIGKILANGIYRLEVKERSQNPQILVDNKPFPSLHSVDSNLNQQAML
jgi:hypothetical protein